MTVDFLKSDLPKLWDDPRLRGYLGEVNRKHGVVDTLALPNMRDLPPIRIESLFVQPLLSQSPVSPISPPESWPEGLSLFSTLQSSPCVVLLGDPGSGKTTLVNWLAWRLSSGFATPLPSILDDRLPIPCVLREMKPATFASDVTVAELAIMVAERLLGKKVNAALKSSLRAHVDAKQYVLILDGVDEIPSAQRDTVASWMRQAANDGVCAMATSRIVGYEDNPICRTKGIDTSVRNRGLKGIVRSDFIIKFENVSSEMLKEYVTKSNEINKQIEQIGGSFEWPFQKTVWAETRYLMPFDQKRIAAFVENWYLQRSGSEQDAIQKTEDLIYALSQSETTQELARTPNLLSLMAIVHRERAHLPDGKALLYKEIANAYINTIDQHRNITVDDALVPYGWEVRESWIAFVGFQMQLERSSGANDEGSSDRHETGVMVSVDKVLAWLTFAMEESGVSKAQLSAQVFLEWVARRSGLLLPRGENLFAFVHLSFQEYFCARYVVNRVVSPKFVKNKLDDDSPVTRRKLKKWANQGLWRESLIYVLELVSGERDSDWVIDLIEILFDSIETESRLGGENAELAVRILADRHIRLSLGWKRSLARRSVDLANMFWRFGLHNSSLVRTLLRTGYAAIYLSPTSESDSEYNDVPFRRLAELSEISINADVFLLIIEGEGVVDISMLAGLKQLSHLSIDSKDLRDISALAGLSNLRSLSLNGERIEDISSLAELTSLETLELRCAKIRDLAALKNMSNLTSLELRDAKVLDISPLSNLKKLQTVSIVNTTLEDISPLSELRGLFNVRIDRSPVHDISALRGLKKLHYLSLRDTFVEDISPLSALLSIDVLDLENTNITNIEGLSKLSHLTHLDLKGTKIVNIAPIMKMKQMRYLVLNGTLVEDLSPLLKLQKLSSLYLQNTRIKEISVLSKLKSLTEVFLSGIQVSDFSILNNFEQHDDFVFRRVTK